MKVRVQGTATTETEIIIVGGDGLDKGAVRGAVHDWLEYPSAETARNLSQTIDLSREDKVAWEYLQARIPDAVRMWCAPSSRDILFIETQYVRTFTETWQWDPMEALAFACPRPAFSRIKVALKKVTGLSLDGHFSKFSLTALAASRDPGIQAMVDSDEVALRFMEAYRKFAHQNLTGHPFPRLSSQSVARSLFDVEPLPDAAPLKEADPDPDPS